MQGYFFAYPMAADEVEAVLEAARPAPRRALA